MIDLSLLPDFIAETGEHLEEMESNLLRLEENPENREVLNDIFRCAHTIKGSAVYLGLEKIGELAHKLESLLEILRRGEQQHSLDRKLIDTLITAKDRIAMLNSDLERSQTEETAIADVIEQIEQIAKPDKKPIKQVPDDVSADDIEPLQSDEISSDGKGEDMPVVVEADLAAIEEFPELDDVQEEEYDNELFQIFTQHLQDNFLLIKNQIQDLPNSGSPGKILNKLLESVKSLHSSANYMEYYKLGNLYDTWCNKIESALKKIDSKESIDFSGFASLSESYITRIESHYSKLPSQAEKKEGLVSLETLDEYEEMPTSFKLSEEEITPAEELKPVEELKLTEMEELIPLEPPVESEKEAEKSVLSELMVEPEKEEIPDREAFSKALAEESKKLVEYQALFDELDDVFETGKADIQEKVSEKESAEYQGLFEELDDVFIEAGSIIKPKPIVEPKKAEAIKVEPEKKVKIDVEQAVQPARKLKASEPTEPLEPVVELEALEPEEVQAVELEKEAASAVSSEGESESKIEARAEKTVKQTLRVDTRKIDSLMNQVGELVVSRAWFSQLYREMRELQHQLQQSGRLEPRELKFVRSLTFKLSEATVGLGRVATDLQEGVMKVRMLPIAQLFNRYPRLVRDLTHGTDKNVRLEILGEETELDKMIIEEISDPLVHIIRNAVDHGCETVSERRTSGKPEQCTLRLESYHESNHVVIEVRDDGRGIDTILIKAKALEKNLYSRDELERMTQKDLLGIIMKPGFSTAAQVTKTSGRGVGMDVVKKNVEKLNGTIEIDSKVGMGTRFRIKIPLTLAIIRALLVRVGTDIFTIPMAAVEETLRIFEKEISVIEGVEVIHLRDSTLSLLRLTDIFGISSISQDSGKSFVVIVNAGMRQVGLVVDELIGQEEAVIKPLVDYLQERSGFSGATILGDGRISLILDVYELVNHSIEKQIKKHNVPAYSEGAAYSILAESNLTYGNATIH